jgi:hypothetical protein
MTEQSSEPRVINLDVGEIANPHHPTLRERIVRNPPPIPPHLPSVLPKKLP